MADEQKHPWYKSVPGVLTAATGFVAALSGLVAGLNQLGVFKREPAPVTVVAPAPPDSAARQRAAGTAGGSSSSAAPASAPRVPAPAPAPAPATTVATVPTTVPLAVLGTSAQRADAGHPLSVSNPFTAANLTGLVALVILGASMALFTRVRGRVARTA